MAAPYLSAQEIRDRVPTLSSSGTYGDEVLEDLVAEFEEVAEDYRGVAFRRRTATHETVLEGDRLVFLPWAELRSVTSVEVDGVAVTGYTPDKLASTIDLGSCYTGTVVVVFEHGLDSPPMIVLRACREYVRACAMNDASAIGRDVIAAADGQGGNTRYSTASKKDGRPTGYLEVDRLLNSVPDQRCAGVG